MSQYVKTFLRLKSELESLIREADKEGKHIESLASPVRCGIDTIRQLQDTMWGEHYPQIEEVLKKQPRSFNDFNAWLSVNRDVTGIINKNHIDMGGFSHIYGITKRFQLRGGKVFTLRKPLVERLKDADIRRDEIEVGMLHSPFENIFIEIGEPEHRSEKLITAKVVDGSLQQEVVTPVEGVYISEIISNTKLNSLAMQRHFGLEDGRPVRMIEIAVSFSYQREQGEKLPQDVLASRAIDNWCSYYTLVVPDEKMSLQEVIDLNVAWLDINKIREDVVSSVLDFVIKALLYINLEERVEHRKEVPREIKERLVAAKNPSKRRKAVIDAMGHYDAIVLGSSRGYISLKQVNTIIGQEGEGGRSVRPHVRRGYMGVRWRNGENGKEKKLSWISPAIVNKKYLSDDEIEMITKNYIVI